jgi:hypothetical protein
MPGEAGSPRQWHTDDFRLSRIPRNYLASTALTTEFAQGKLPYKKRQSPSQTLVTDYDNGVPKDVTVFRPNVGDIYLVGYDVVHRAPINDTEQPIDRLFVELQVSN